MTAVSEDATADLNRRIAELEQRLELALIERDAAIERQTASALVNFRLQNELRAAHERQNASAEILRTIADLSGDADQLLHLIAETTARLFGAPSVTMVLAEGENWGQTINFGASSERVRARVAAERPRLGGDNLPGTVFRENRQIHIPDLDHIDPAMAHWPVTAARAEGTRTVAATPLRREGKPIGVLIVYRHGLAPFTDEELALQQSFADQAVIAIENARLFNETQEALERQTATADILKVIASSPSDVQPVFEAIASSANRLIGGFSAAVHRVIDGIVHLVAFTSIDPEADEALKAAFPVHLSEMPSVALVQNGETVQVADAETADPQTRGLGRARGWRSVTFTPLMNQGACIGFIACTRREPGVLADHHVQLLRTFADQAVIAIENARLFNETQEALERQTATADILKVIASSPSDVQPVFDAIAERSNQLVNGLSTSVLSLVDDALHMVAHTKVGPAADAALKAYYPQPLSTFAWGETVRRGEIIRIPDSEDEAATPSAVREVARARGWRSATLVPLLRDRRPIGMISVTRRETGLFADHHMQLLQTFADQAVIAIENTRLFNETKEALERQTATADILKVIASSPSDTQPVFEAIATSANRLLAGYSTAVFRLFDGTVHLAAFTPTNPAADEALKADFPKPVDAFEPLQLTRPGEPFPIPDTEEIPYAPIREIARLHGFRSMLFVPLMNGGLPIGVISVTRSEPGSFAPKHVQLLQTFADQAVIAIENTRLFNEVQARTLELSEALEQQTATSEVLSVISSSAGDLAPVFDAMLAKAMQLCSANFGVLNTYDGKLFHSAATYGLPPAYDEYRRKQPLDYGPGTAPARLLQGEPMVEIDELLETEAYRNGDANRRALVDLGGARCLLAVPLLKDERVVGNVMIFRQEKRPFSDKQIALLQQFAAQAVIAIENTRLLRELRQSTEDLSESLQQQTATSEVLQIISSSPSDLAPVFEKMLENATRVCGAEFGSMNLVEGDTFRRAALYNAPPAFAAARSNTVFPIHPQSSIAAVIRGKQVVQLEDMRNGVAYLARNPAAVELVELGGARTIVVVPMVREDEVIGVITVYRQEVRPFGDKQIDLLTNFARQAVIAIENARLLRELRQRTDDLTESLHFQTATSDVLKVISRSPDALQPVLDVIVETSRELCGSDASTIFLLRDEKFHVTAVSGLLPAHLDHLKANPLSIGQPGSILSRVYDQKRTLNYDNVLDDPELSQGSTGLGGARALLTVPLMSEGQVIGAITLRQSHLKPFTPRQIQAIETFADQAVIAISNVNLFEQVQQRTRELSKSLDELRTAQDRLIQTEKLASLGQLTAGIAHEIKNPLNFVNNFAALSAELTDELNEALKPAVLDEAIRAEVDELTSTLKDNLGKVVQHGKRADSIVKNMLLHSREGSGEHRPADINALVDESLNLAYHGARAEKPHFNVTLQRNFDPEAGMIEVFPQEITRVFLNLISNGFYAVSKRKADHGDGSFEGVVTATTKGRTDHVEICIRDNGTGIPPDVKERMFNPFFTTKPAGEGTGLGLSMSHDIIVKQHGGTIDVDTLQGEFTEFTIILPRTSNLSNKSRG